MKLLNTKNLNLFLLSIILCLLFCLFFAIKKAVEYRKALDLVQKEINKRVEEKIEWYVKNLENYKKQIEQLKAQVEKAEEEAIYYRNIYKKLQIAKIKIKLPKSSKELRERFERLGYPPVN